MGYVINTSPLVQPFMVSGGTPANPNFKFQWQRFPPAKDGNPGQFYSSQALYLQRSTLATTAAQQWPVASAAYASSNANGQLPRAYVVAYTTPVAQGDWVTVQSWNAAQTVNLATTVGWVTTQDNPGAPGNYIYRLIYYVTETATGDTYEVDYVPHMATTGGPGSLPWLRHYGSTLNDAAVCCQIDSSGNVYIAGYFKGTINLGGSNLVSPGGACLYIAKYDSSGNHQWSFRYGGTGDTVCTCLALDASANLFVCGNFLGSTNLGGSTFTSAGSYDAFIVKYTSAGAHSWSYAFGKTGNDNFNRLAILPGSGDVIVGGSFLATGSAPMNFGTPGHAGSNLYNSFPNQSVCIVRFSNSGDHVWSQLFDGGGDNYVNGIVTDSSGNIYLAGEFKGYIFFGGGSTSLHDNSQFQNTWLAKFNSNGGWIWSIGYGDTNAQRATALTLDSSNNLIVGGMFYLRGNFGGGVVIGTGTDQDIWIAKYDSSNGAHIWSNAILGNYSAYVFGIGCDASDNVLITGQYYGTRNFAGNKTQASAAIQPLATSPITSQCLSLDVYVAKYTPLGLIMWVQSFGGCGADAGNWVTIDSNSYPVVCGYFSNDPTTGGGVPFGTQTITSNGGTDTFLMKILP